jgi:uncharacterized membrane protein YkoI
MARARHYLLAPGILAAALRTAEADPSVCLSQEQRRAAVATHRAVPLARAVHDVHSRAAGSDVVGARLCYRDGQLVYLLTVLTRDGKVIRASVNAASGALIEGH